MFMADALVRRAAPIADDGRALAVQRTVNDDDLQASEHLPTRTTSTGTGTPSGWARAAAIPSIWR